METMGMLSEGEWNCLHGMCNEEADFMNELFANCSFQGERNEASLWPSHESTINMVAEGNQYNHVPVFESLVQKRKFGMPDAVFGDTSNTYSPVNPHTKAVALQEVSRKKKKIISSCKLEEEPNAGVNGPSSSSSDSGDDTKGGPGNLNGKASKGSATDPQSLYARKRRDRINERLRILQSLVPNGTKVDISTMLEEAVEYVKFLQLQIKLLSSDEHWMYAPIAYNGVNLGFRS